MRKLINYQRLYEYRFRNVDQTRRTDVWSVIAPAIHEWLGHPERMLDPAAGRCEFLNAISAEERWAIDAVEYEEAIPDDGIRFLISDVMRSDLPHSYFDGIFVSNFLEHLPSPDEVAAFLNKMRDCINPGGRIAVMGPNFRYCVREYFDFADHRVILTEESAAEHLYAAGFEVKQVIPRFLPYSFGGRLPTHPALVRAYLKTRFAWPLLGKQFLVIAERPPIPGPERTEDISTDISCQGQLARHG
jgi:SAM-dependent methyltransferase